jgi:hypothetical protein
MSFRDGQDKATRAHDIADRIVKMAHANAARAMRQAGVSDFNCLHNALVSANYGKPWAEVDYRLARKARWMFDRQFMAHDVACRYTARLWDAHRSEGK